MQYFSLEQNLWPIYIETFLFISELTSYFKIILNCHSDRLLQTPLTDYLRFKPFCITKDCVLVIWYINVATVELFNPANRQMAKL